MMGYGFSRIGGGWGYGIFSWLSMLLFWVIIIILAVILLFRFFTNSARDNKSDKTSQTPMDILKERYAKGEINKKEFEDMKKDLK